ncbi:putative CRISPR-associated protein [Pseudothermotoga thermarum]|uniref:CRISPR-associated protein, APE2256 family n=1 Tax=Pseudothermotoga thermarum DSM 5069 TaxID=688269 RepID=F7YTM3_9THEM|nr:putative CRISPR-associated protein [Pseudothermotoga thermarum]AEH51245.1 CRISPR-associated protein, APE2256 family [Pseudothermotoga thermarum DSM 5069]
MAMEDKIFVITSVGLSLVENYSKNGGTAYLSSDLLQKSKSENCHIYKDEIEKRDIKSWISKLEEKECINCCAEIKSLEKIVRRLENKSSNQALEVVLIKSDTIGCHISVEVLLKVLPDVLGSVLQENIQLQISKKFIKDLNLENPKTFRQGIKNLVCEVSSFFDKGKLVFDITGGYKSVIAVLSILAQINQSPAFYVYEDTDCLIEIPPAPIRPDLAFFEKYKELFQKDGIVPENEIPNGFPEELLDILDENENGKFYYLNPFAKELFKKCGKYALDSKSFLETYEHSSYEEIERIITVVGSSVFERNELLGKDDIEKAERSPANCEERECKKLEKKLKDKQNENLNCAELDSIMTILKKNNIDHSRVEIYLLYTDTLISKLAAEYVKNRLEKMGIKSKSSVIQGLRIDDSDKFIKMGLVNLLNEVYKIADRNWKKVCFNITTGFKSIVPYLTFLAMVNKSRIFYKFELADELFQIPPLPISIDWSLIKNNEKNLLEVEFGDCCISKQSYEELRSLVEKSGDKYVFTGVGRILWKKYLEINDIHALYLSDSALKKYEKLKKSDENHSTAFEKSLKELLKELHNVGENFKSRDKLCHDVGCEELKKKGFCIFKDEKERLQLRIIWKCEKTELYNTYKVYVNEFYIGKEVHNAENEYVNKCRESAEKILKVGGYRLCKLCKDGLIVLT